MDELEKRVKIFFNDCKRCPGELPSSVKAEFDAIGKEYKKTLEDADEKVNTRYLLTSICLKNFWLVYGCLITLFNSKHDFLLSIITFSPVNSVFC